MKQFIEALKRTVALIATEVAAIMAAGAILDVEAWKSATLAAIAAALKVWSAIGRAYYTDGELTRAEVNKAFKK